MQYDIIKETGSDASYDLIIEAVRPCPERGYCLKVNDREQAVKAEAMAQQLVAMYGIQDRDWGIRINLFERFPDGWVWQARVEALLEKIGPLTAC